MATYIIKATYIGSNAGPFDIVDSLGNTIATAISAAEILAGYQITVDDAATSVTLLSVDCGPFVIPIVPGTTTTSTTSTTSTTTAEPTTTTTSTTSTTTSTTSTTTCDCSITAEADVYVYEGPADASTTTTTTTAAPFDCTMPQYSAIRQILDAGNGITKNVINIRAMTDLVMGAYGETLMPNWGKDVAMVSVVDENGNELFRPKDLFSFSEYLDDVYYFTSHNFFVLDNGATTVTITAQGPKCFGSVTIPVQ